MKKIKVLVSRDIDCGDFDKGTIYFNIPLDMDSESLEYLVNATLIIEDDSDLYKNENDYWGV